ncbi:MULTISPECIES: hypothetical protein [unclassified Mucilaginibacter]|uniref:hypothetical protein n=1 Tax=unclassified Mucilaginibacter TaxID=2617802 RepID=UPI002AC8B1D4|nr:MULTISPECIES: hypothetical protein [unclassified Mucilaginibacter]MEB0262100.1 hypothetical protein [Mucilaginibacter sp. 10I4]MEB0278790.1 hypothetical protein [Mucilaginibacter sp. 10B2]MEB0299845.1 hypothetical protein [Mucilaginibacter sp. 5C4]WPX21973.1 hypothetical protein RHM67_11835 [Mucilaginibacter sp. 5C4]
MLINLLNTNKQQSPLFREGFVPKTGLFSNQFIEDLQRIAFLGGLMDTLTITGGTKVEPSKYLVKYKRNYFLRRIDYTIEEFVSPPVQAKRLNLYTRQRPVGVTK